MTAGRRRGRLLAAACLTGLLLIACGSGPNRLEILRHKREIVKFRRQKDDFLKSSVDSPLGVEQRWAFAGLRYFPVDIAYRLAADFVPAPASAPPRGLKTSSGRHRPYKEAGTLNFQIDGRPLSLKAYRAEDGGGLFVPFGDTTNGRDTYGGGRYLDVVPAPDGGALTLDFNLAYNPYCAYNPLYSCPLPPPENHLPVPVRAGEKTPPAWKDGVTSVPRFEP